MIIAIVDDLLFRAKIHEAAARRGVAVRPAVDAASAVRALHDDPGSLVLIDLNLSGGDPVGIVAAIRRAEPAAQIVGYCSHVQANLQALARAAGCAAVWPRSALIQRLSEVMAGASGGFVCC